jgi:hypothetical protein
MPDFWSIAGFSRKRTHYRCLGSELNLLVSGREPIEGGRYGV